MLHFHVNHHREMSVDVFGRQLTKSVVKAGVPGSRGPPGEGFKITSDGNYDMEQKRLCNVGDPAQENDAVTLKAIQSIVQQEIRLVYQITSSLRHDVDDNGVMIRSLESQFRDDVKTQRINSETVQDLVTRNSQLITHLEERLKALERGSSSTSDDNRLMIQRLESNVREDLKRLETESKAGQELAYHNSEVISQLDRRIVALEHGS